MSYEYNYVQPSSDGIIDAFGMTFVIMWIIYIAVAIFQIVCVWKVYKKAGKDGWEAIVPYYNSWVLCEIAGVKWWFFLGMCASSICGILGLIALEPLAALAGIAFSFAVNYNIALKFGKDGVGYGIGLTLLPVVFYAILGFGDATFTDVKVSSYGPIEEDKIEKKAAPVTEEKEAPKKKTSKSAKFCKNCGAEINDAKFCPNCGSEIH